MQYALLVDRAVTMHGLAGDGEQLADMPHPSRVLAACFCGRDGILTGLVLFALNWQLSDELLNGNACLLAAAATATAYSQVTSVTCCPVILLGCAAAWDPLQSDDAGSVS